MNAIPRSQATVTEAGLEILAGEEGDRECTLSHLPAPLRPASAAGAAQSASRLQAAAKQKEAPEGNSLDAVRFTPPADSTFFCWLLGAFPFTGSPLDDAGGFLLFNC